MENIKIPAGERTPEIDFDFASNTFVIKGESFPEDVNAFFGPLVDKLEQHLSAIEGQQVSFSFEFIYFNSSTAKCLINLFDTLDEAANSGNDVSVIWIYEADDDNMEEMGEEFGEDLEHASFEMKKLDI